MSTTRGRQIAPNQVVYDQADFFNQDGFTRVNILQPADMQLEVYHDNVLLPWTLVDGVGVTDAQIASGKVYVMHIPSGPYSVRWRPNSIGYWRILLTYPAGQQIVAQDFDVGGASSGGGGSSSSSSSSSSGGLKASFVRPGDRRNGC